MLKCSWHFYCLWLHVCILKYFYISTHYLAALNDILSFPVIINEAISKLLCFLFCKLYSSISYCCKTYYPKKNKYLLSYIIFAYQEFRSGLAGRFWLRVSWSCSQTLGQATVIWKHDWGWRITFQDYFLTWLLAKDLSSSPCGAL